MPIFSPLSDLSRLVDAQTRSISAENPDGAGKFETAARQETIDLLRKLGASE